MGRILDVLRRKRSALSPRADEASGAASDGAVEQPLSPSAASVEVVLDKENARPRVVDAQNVVSPSERSHKSDASAAREERCMSCEQPEGEDAADGADDCLVLTHTIAANESVDEPAEAPESRGVDASEPEPYTEADKLDCGSDGAAGEDTSVSASENSSEAAAAASIDTELDVALASTSESDNSSEVAAAGVLAATLGGSGSVTLPTDDSDSVSNDTDDGEPPAIVNSNSITSETDDSLVVHMLEDDRTHDSGIPLLSTSESTEQSSEAGVTAFTEVSDDGVLRDDEGNPIDPNEVREIMLRDDEGNIIDPKTLVLRESFSDGSCGSEEYGEGDECVAQLGAMLREAGLSGSVSPPLISSDSESSDEQAESDVDSIGEGSWSHVIRPLDGSGMNAETTLRDNDGSQTTDAADDRPKDAQYPNQVQNADEATGMGIREQRMASSRRRRRRGKEGAQDDSVHVIFHNNLSIVQEERSYPSDEDADYPSDEDADSFVSDVSFNEKYMRARWEYSLRMMSSGLHLNSGALIDARDEINDILMLNGDCSVELETGEV